LGMHTCCHCICRKLCAACSQNLACCWGAVISEWPATRLRTCLTLLHSIQTLPLLLTLASPRPRAQAQRQSEAAKVTDLAREVGCCWDTLQAWAYQQPGRCCYML
jgi:hypothetical protein